MDTVRFENQFYYDHDSKEWKIRRYFWRYAHGRHDSTDNKNDAKPTKRSFANYWLKWAPIGYWALCVHGKHAIDTKLSDFGPFCVDCEHIPIEDIKKMPLYAYRTGEIEQGHGGMFFREKEGFLHFPFCFPKSSSDSEDVELFIRHIEWVDNWFKQKFGVL